MMSVRGKEKYKQLVRSLLIPHGNVGISVRQLFHELEQIEGHSLPFIKLGYESEYDFIRDIPDVAKVRYDCLEREEDLIVRVVGGDESTAHIEKFVSEQREHDRENNGHVVVRNSRWGMNDDVQRRRRNIETQPHLKNVPYSLHIKEDEDKSDDLILLSHDTNLSVKKRPKAVCPMPDVRFIHVDEKERIRCMLNQFPDGIQLIHFIPIYHAMFHTHIKLIPLGYQCLKEYLSDIPNIVMLEYKSDGICVVKPVMPIDKSESIKTYATKSRSNRELVITNAKKLIPQSELDHFRSILSSHPNGLRLGEFAGRYKTQTGRYLNETEWGFNSVVEMIKKLPDLFFIEDKSGKDDPINYVIHLVSEKTIAIKKEADINRKTLQNLNITQLLLKKVFYLVKYLKKFEIKELETHYFIIHGEKLDVQKLGFSSVSEFIKFIAKKMPIELYKNPNNQTFIKLVKK